MTMVYYPRDGRWIQVPTAWQSEHWSRWMGLATQNLWGTQWDGGTWVVLEGVSR